MVMVSRNGAGAADFNMQRADTFNESSWLRFLSRLPFIFQTGKEINLVATQVFWLAGGIL